jgi:uncharacterized damage-inducible protein DinB
MMNSQSNDAALLEAVIEALKQSEVLFTEISNEIYTRRLPAAFNASIGAHARHCLDHFRGVADAAAAGDLNYDHRERDTPIENDRFAALHAARELRGRFEVMNTGCLARGLAVTCKTNYATDESQTVASTVGREIMYAVAHAVHHYALIGVMAGMMGVALPAGFGVAPATLKHQGEAAKAA